MQVIATSAGFDGVGMRYPGDTFDMPDGSKAPWFDPVAHAEPKHVQTHESKHAKESEPVAKAKGK